MSLPVTFRTFRLGDGTTLPPAWTDAAPGDGITEHRFRELVLLDRNFDPDGLFVAESEGRPIGAAYAVRRTIAQDKDDLEPGCGWIPFFFVTPAAQGAGVGTALLRRSLDWLRKQGVHTVDFSGYTPNYFLPGIDGERYPAGVQLLSSCGFTRLSDAVAMDRTLNDYVLPVALRERAERLRGQGYRLGTPTGDDLVDLIAVAGSRFNADWSRGIREAVLTGLALERIQIARAPDGELLGWAMCGTYENVLERFGPFGVVPESRGTGLGELLLHLTLERMRSLGAHSAWFLWTGEDSPAGRLYAKTGFTVTRTFTLMRAQL